MSAVRPAAVEADVSDLLPGHGGAGVPRRRSIVLSALVSFEEPIARGVRTMTSLPPRSCSISGPQLRDGARVVVAVPAPPTATEPARTKERTPAPKAAGAVNEQGGAR